MALLSRSPAALIGGSCCRNSSGVIRVSNIPQQSARHSSSHSCPRQAHLQAPQCPSWRAQRTPLVVAAAGQAGGTSVTQQQVLVEEVMNPKPILLQEGMSIKDAVHAMLDANVSGAPVVNTAGKIVGVLTEADVIWKGAGKPEDHFIIPPVFIGALDAYVFLRDNKAFEEETHKILARTVKDAMVGKDRVVTVQTGSLMSEAAQLMVHHDVNLLPVVEADGSVVGIVTRHDILRGLYASKNPLL